MNFIRLKLDIAEVRDDEMRLAGTMLGEESCCGHCYTTQTQSDRRGNSVQSARFCPVLSYRTTGEIRIRLSGGRNNRSSEIKLVLHTGCSAQQNCSA